MEDTEDEFRKKQKTMKQETTNGVVANGHSNGTGSSQKQELVRLMIQSLQDYGYAESAKTIEHESGYKLQSPEIVEFKRKVLNGEWDTVEDLLPALGLAEESAKIAKFYLRQQRYMELLEARRTKEALSVLRSELSPLDCNLDKLHLLSRCVASGSRSA